MLDRHTEQASRKEDLLLNHGGHERLLRPPSTTKPTPSSVSMNSSSPWNDAMPRGEKKGRTKAIHKRRHRVGDCPTKHGFPNSMTDIDKQPSLPQNMDEDRNGPRSMHSVDSTCCLLGIHCISSDSATINTTTSILSARSAEGHRLPQNKDIDCCHHDGGILRPAPRTWVAKVEWALGQLGGRGTLADIYAVIEDSFGEELDGKRNWKAAIRSCLSKNEKNKFFKPSTRCRSTKEHLWSLAPVYHPSMGGRGGPLQRSIRYGSRHSNAVRRSSAEHTKEGIKCLHGDNTLSLELEPQTEERENGDGLSLDQENFLQELLSCKRSEVVP